MKKTITLAVAGALISLNAYAKTTLQDVLNHVYQYSDSLNAQREKFKSDKISAMGQARAGFLPNVYYNAQFDKTDSKTIDGAEINAIDRNLGRQRTKSSTLVVEQNLFNSGEDASKVEITQKGIEASKAQLFSAEQKMVTDTVDAYLKVLYTQQKVENMAQNLKSAQDMLEAAREKYNAGVATRTDVANAETAVSRAMSQKAQIDAQFQGAVAFYKNMIGLELDELEEPSLPQNLPQTQEETIELAKKNNPNLIASKKKLDQADANLRGAYTKFGPSVDLVAKVGKQIYNPQTNSINNSGRNNKFHEAIISVKVPIFQKGTEYSGARSASAGKASALADYKNASNAIITDAISNWRVYEARKIVLRETEKTVEAYQIMLDGYNQEYNEGVKGIEYVLDAMNNLYNAKNSLLDAKQGLIEAAYTLKSMTGALGGKSLGLKYKVDDLD